MVPPTGAYKNKVAPILFQLRGDGGEQVEWGVSPKRPQVAPGDAECIRTTWVRPKQAIVILGEEIREGCRGRQGRQNDRD